MKVAKLFIAVLLLALPINAHAVDVVRVVSPGGIEAWLVEDHANPLLSMQFAFAGGTELDPVGKSGLANLAAGTMDEGAGDLDSRAFQQRLTDNAIHLRFNARIDEFSGNLKTLSETEDLAFDLLRLALTEPRFDDEPVARLKSQIQAGIRHDREDPDTLAFEELFRGFFSGHGYALRSEGSEENVAAITADDLRAFVATRLARGNLKIGVVGDITPDRLGRLLDRAFAHLPAEPQVKRAADIAPKVTGRLAVIEMDVVQSAIVFGHAGPKRDDLDYYVALIMNHILGGGSFTSRLYEEVREKRGLAYSVGSNLYPLDRAGLIVGSAGTENARVGETVKIIRDEWRRMAGGDLTADELDRAKTNVTGSFPLSFTSTDKIASVLVAMQTNNLGIDYLEKRNAYIEAVTLDDVKRVAAQVLRADMLDVIVVGKPQGVTPTP
jgi:zinc protease